MWRAGLSLDGHRDVKGNEPFTSLPVSLPTDLTDEKYTSSQHPGIFSSSGNLQILIKTRRKAGMEKRQNDGAVLLVIGLFCDQHD